jgi:hypothetical protein
MARLPVEGDAMVTPPGTVNELRSIIDRLNTEFRLNILCADNQLYELWLSLGSVHAQFLQEAERPTAKAVNARLATLARACTEILDILAIERGGFHELPPEKLAAFFQLREILMHSPRLRTMDAVSNLLLSIVDQTEQIKHASEVAKVDLAMVKGKRGRDQLAWYDALTGVLVDFASLHGIPTAVSDDNAKGVPSGPFYRLAESVEGEFPKELHAPSAKARAGRLRRALGRLEAEQK